MFEAHLAPADWRQGLTTERPATWHQVLRRLQSNARQVLVAAWTPASPASGAIASVRW